MRRPARNVVEIEDHCDLGLRSTELKNKDVLCTQEIWKRDAMSLFVMLTVFVVRRRVNAQVKCSLRDPNCRYALLFQDGIHWNRGQIISLES